MGSDSLGAAGVTVERFRRLVEDRLRDRGIVGSVAVEPTQTAGLSLVSVEIDSGPSILYESAEWVPGSECLIPMARTSRSPQHLTTSNSEPMASSPPPH